MSGAALGALGAADAIPGIDAIAIPLTVGLLAVTAVAALHAHQTSQSGLSDQAPAVPCPSCADELPCFNTPDGADPAEMKRQLKEQQDKINEQSPEEMQKRLDEADGRKAETGSYRPEGDAKARDGARTDFQDERQSELQRAFRAQGYSGAEAARMAADQTTQEMSTQDATHELDSIVGGNEYDKLSLGGRTVNRSIGSQWKSRVKALKQAVKRAKERGQKKMNVKLEPCEPTS
ncbi:polymorphic toxin type 15 domain-containing protein [Acidiphilium sp. PA]|uniref:polymorphic toxin type 15 domain-containing protein n=1 Tax=Acidiphilium sp. PA TaxID=2871705 RepID=UPI002243137E|nr:polymorphic toxin type 15 domain-containing protein [Acidiphilium sp. PA]MCW8308657.1 polymorphic toxin type 15 domain-containing protein [Acidiphilium sp. PA]